MSEEEGFLGLPKEVWPQERDFIARPERYKYVRKLIQPEGCVFCAAAAKQVGFESLCLYKNQRAMVMLNKFPYNSGHLLVLPVQHCGDLLDLPLEDYNEVTLLLRQSVKIIKSVYNCLGLNIGLNHGAVAGAGIPDHLHWHIVPRWAGDTNFFPLVAETKVIPESLEQTYEKLEPHFKNL